MKDTLRKKLTLLEDRYQSLSDSLSDPKIISDQNKFRDLSKEFSEIEPVVTCFKEFSVVENLNDSLLDELVVTDTIPLSPKAQACEKIRQLSLGELLAEAIRRVNVKESVSSMFPDD